VNYLRLIKSGLEGFLGKLGVFKVGIVDPEQRFKMVKTGCHPRDVMKNCNFVVIFARADSRKKKKVMLCGYCYNNRPVGEVSEETFHLSKWRTLLDLKKQERKLLLQTLDR
jgi:hypothetical protein